MTKKQKGGFDTVKIENIEFNKVYTSNNFGDFIVVKEVERKQIGKNKNRQFLVRFVNTGYEYKALMQHIKNCAVKDPYVPIAFGVGYLGSVEMKKYHKEYLLWRRMLSRCYNPKDSSYRYYGGIGVSVVKEWLCFSKFLEDFKTLDGYSHWINGEKCDLDKDLKQQNVPKNERVYSKNTCCILIREQNVYMASRDFHDKSTRKYYGVKQLSENKYAVNISIKGKNTYLGTFSDEIVAANVYNYWSDIYNHKTKNSVEYIPIDEFDKYRIDIHSPKQKKGSD